MICKLIRSYYKTSAQYHRCVLLYKNINSRFRDDIDWGIVPVRLASDPIDSGICPFMKFVSKLIAPRYCNYPISEGRVP